MIFQRKRSRARRLCLKAGAKWRADCAVEFEDCACECFYDSRQHINADGDPDLRLHRVLGRSIEMFDA
jgi:hypothetical protein